MDVCIDTVDIKPSKFNLFQNHTFVLCAQNLLQTFQYFTQTTGSLVNVLGKSTEFKRKRLIPKTEHKGNTEITIGIGFPRIKIENNKFKTKITELQHYIQSKEKKGTKRLMGVSILSMHACSFFFCFFFFLVFVFILGGGGYYLRIWCASQSDFYLSEQKCRFSRSDISSLSFYGESYRKFAKFITLHLNFIKISKIYFDTYTTS